MTTTQIYRVYIKATPQAIWDAITKPEWTDRYGYTGRVDYDLRPGGAYRARPSEKFKASAPLGYTVPDTIIEGKVLEADPPLKLVTTFHMLTDPELIAEPVTKITHEIREGPGGVCQLTVSHDLDGAPKLAAIVSGAKEAAGAGGGHAWALSDLKTLLETGKSFAN